MKSRKFLCREFHHVYQRTLKGFNIFYDLEDYLVYYTIFSVMSRKYGIIVLGLCLMIDHIHSLIASDDKKIFSRFLSSVTIQFVKEYNEAYGRSGQLFERFGSAPKKGLKLLRTAVAYLYNNPVEKHLCKRAQCYRWNFLSCYPGRAPKFSLNTASRPMRRALKEIDYTLASGRHLKYAQLYRLLNSVGAQDKDRLADYIIVKYSVIRYDILADCYGGYENMLLAVNSNAGSEYEIAEVKDTRSDVGFRELYRYIHSKGFLRAGDVITLPISEKMSLANEMMYRTSADLRQICKYLHLEYNPRGA